LTYAQSGSDGSRSADAGASGTWTSDPIAVDPAKSYDFAVDASARGAP